MNVDFEPSSLPGVIVIKPRIFGDSRGFFLESWQERKFAAGGINARFVQDNHSRSVQHTLRGLHYQIQQPQGKLLRVIRGVVYDVAVDMRRSSPSFGKWFGVTLSDENGWSIWVPPGFAHGFLVLSDVVDVVYKCTDFYAPEYERVLSWDDPAVGIDWPLPAQVAPILSARDARGARLDEAECFP